MKISYWDFVFYITATAVLFLALIPASAELPTTGWDKSNHLLAFGVLAYLGNKAYPQNSLKLSIGLIGFGGLIEVLQTFTPTRFGEWEDLVADGVGVLLGWLLFKRF